MSQQDKETELNKIRLTIEEASKVIREQEIFKRKGCGKSFIITYRAKG